MIHQAPAGDWPKSQHQLHSTINASPCLRSHISFLETGPGSSIRARFESFSCHCMKTHPLVSPRQRGNTVSHLALHQPGIYSLRHCRVYNSLQRDTITPRSTSVNQGFPLIRDPLKLDLLNTKAPRIHQSPLPLATLRRLYNTYLIHITCTCTCTCTSVLAEPTTVFRSALA